jgi:hypothetical protein
MVQNIVGSLISPSRLNSSRVMPEWERVHSLEDRGNECHQTSKKEEYREVKEYTSGFECT